MTSATFPARLREAREHAGQSIRGLAAAADVSPGQIVHWEAGRADPARGTVERLAKALAVSASWLAFGE